MDPWRNDTVPCFVVDQRLVCTYVRVFGLASDSTPRLEVSLMHHAVGPLYSLSENLLVWLVASL